MALFYNMTPLERKVSECHSLINPFSFPNSLLTHTHTHTHTYVHTYTHTYTHTYIHTHTYTHTHTHTHIHTYVVYTSGLIFPERRLSLMAAFR